MKKILTIAGYDPSNGAGITKDLEIFSSLGTQGISVPTCMVLQGPHGVSHVYPVPYPQFYEMIDMVKRQSPVDGIKIGALWNEAYVEKIALFLSRFKHIPLVIDPIVAAKNGVRLVTDEGLKRMTALLFPVADIVTPNIHEAAVITGKKVSTLKDMKACAKEIFAMGPQVIIKGGHLKGEPVDVFFDGKEFAFREKHRIKREVHGTGCMFSSLMAAFLAYGYDRREAFFASEEFMEELLNNSYRIDTDGYFYASSGVINSGLSDRWRVLQAMKEAKHILHRVNMAELIPEVQMNIGYAIKGARGVEDVAAFPGRIGRNEGRMYMKGEAAFGASSHVARFILTYMKYYPQIRACANVKYDKGIIEKAHKSGLHAIFFDRKKEPQGVRKAEGRGLDFLVDQVLKGAGSPPDIIYDPGHIGKEPVIRLFAKDPLELIKKMEMIRP